jgi:2,3-bisphosphoglycerate-independent phosphoglycerate mutase
VPFAIKSPFWTADGIQGFDEVSAKNGGFGLVNDESLVSLLIASGKSSKQRKD